MIYSLKKNPNKMQLKENGETPILSQYITSKSHKYDISASHQKQSFADILQNRCF